MFSNSIQCTHLQAGRRAAAENQVVTGISKMKMDKPLVQEAFLN
jgi:hypothetical protein